MTAKNQTRKLKENSFKRSSCPIACTLDIIGDKWTLLIVRDFFLGKNRYNEFLESGEGITTNILADRLQRLEKSGLVSKMPYQEKPLRYEYYLTETGKTLESVVWSIVDWANKQLPGTYKPQHP